MVPASLNKPSRDRDFADIGLSCLRPLSVQTPVRSSSLGHNPEGLPAPQIVLSQVIWRWHHRSANGTLVFREEVSPESALPENRMIATLLPTRHATCHRCPLPRQTWQGYPGSDGGVSPSEVSDPPEGPKGGERSCDPVGMVEHTE